MSLPTAPSETGHSEHVQQRSDVLTDLERGGALNTAQVQRLLASWPSLPDDWAASPYFGTVHEHTRSCIDQLRAEESAAAASTPILPTPPKELMPYAPQTI